MIYKNDILVIIFVSIVLMFVRKIYNKNIIYSNLKKFTKYIFKLSPREFEFFCAKIFNNMGYKTYVTKESKDGGKDIILNNKYYVECKRYKGCVDKSIAQKLCGAMQEKNIKKGCIITSGHFSIACLEYCKKMNIRCIDLKNMFRLCKKYRVK